ncbi:MAG: hypothetical protein IKP02_07640 [Paludibacteraceae bacterium]|nr:hypothetical protein [Paludibacteraceae bacterium]
MLIKKDKVTEYQEGYNNNLDPYGHAVYTFAERWAELMEREILKSEDPDAVITAQAEHLSHEADTEGITGFMYGCAVSILSACWLYGEQLRVWHNAQYRYAGDGVVNPAIMTIGR